MTDESDDLAPLDTDDPTILNELIFLKDASKITPYTPEYLKNLAHKKRLRTIKKGRDYQTTRAWIQDYLKSKHQGKRTDLP